MGHRPARRAFLVSRKEVTVRKANVDDKGEKKLQTRGERITKKEEYWK